MERTSEMTLPEWAEIPRSLVEGDIRETMLPYGHQSVSEEDIRAVVDVLRSDWLTTGPQVDAFEDELAQFCGQAQATVVSNGTAALHAAMHAVGIGPEDEVIVPAITFSATANAVVYCDGIPVFADVESQTGLLDPADVERKISPRTRAIIAVDYAGQPCDYERLREIADRNGLRLIADACHSIGARYEGRPVGSLADASVFSFHPVKGMTTGEGGAVTTDDSELATATRRFRNHGIATDHRQRNTNGQHRYDMVDLGWNYRLSDIQCALGRSQLRRLPRFIARRHEIAETYDRELKGVCGVSPLVRHKNRTSAHHLYPVLLDPELISRDPAFAHFRSGNIGVNVHYLPVYLHSFYKDRFGTRQGLCPMAEAFYDCVLTLPIYPTMTDSDINDVVHVADGLIKASWK